LSSDQIKLADSIWERARGAWPDVKLARDDFAAWLVERFGAQLVEENERLQWEDLYLAAACLLGSPGAAEAFTLQLEPALRHYVAGVERREEAVGELVQELLVRLLVGVAGDGPKLGEYSGRGPLRAWLRMVAVRHAISRARERQRHVGLEERMAHEAVRDGEDPELAILHARYRTKVADAFRDALAALTPHDRSLLRLVYGQGTGLDAIGAMHGWSKPTASRRVAAARAAVLEEATRLLRQQLGASGPEVESLMRVLQSRLDMSLSGLFATKSHT
jgi:RNA polymerase sigma-70 factor (ECF subfamily)